MSLRAVKMAEGQGLVFFSLPNSAKIWDSAAAHVIVSEIGGTYTNLKGDPLSFSSGAVVHEKGAIATIGISHETVLEKLQAALQV